MYVEAQDGIEEDQKGVEISQSADLEDAERADGGDVLEKKKQLAMTRRVVFVCPLHSDAGDERRGIRTFNGYGRPLWSSIPLSLELPV
jgi:hypothetical protein